MFEEVKELIEVLQKLPTIGPKTAEKITFFLITDESNLSNEIINAISKLKENIIECSNCYSITIKFQNPCKFCISKERENKICVVSNVKDVIHIEETNSYHGKYHVLKGLINPLENMTPDKLTIEKLIKRIEIENVKEVIFALPTNLEGETTINYIAKKIKKIDDNIILTKLAIGLPAGSELDYADKITIINALKERKKIL
ncbi:MAG: recombination mediator RecR [bacterium]|nr:recombination mediator RecR [bacterium]